MALAAHTSLNFLPGHPPIFLDACLPSVNPPLQTAHVGALYSAFLAMMVATGVPPVIAAISLGFMSNLFGSITHFGSGQAAVYYGAGGQRASVLGVGLTLTAAASRPGGG